MSQTRWCQNGHAQKNSSPKQKGLFKSFDKMQSKTEKKKKKATGFQQSNGPTSNGYRRTHSGRAPTLSDRCLSVISITRWNDGYFYLDASATNLMHNGHCEIPPEAKKLGMENVSDTSNALVQKLASIGVRPFQIAQLLDQLDDNTGQYDPKTVSNIIAKHDILKDEAMGISIEMSSAERCMKYLSE
jgi:hypothetical protein